MISTQGPCIIMFWKGQRGAQLLDHRAGLVLPARAILGDEGPAAFRRTRAVRDQPHMEMRDAFQADVGVHALRPHHPFQGCVQRAQHEAVARHLGGSHLGEIEEMALGDEE